MDLQKAIERDRKFGLTRRDLGLERLLRVDLTRCTTKQPIGSKFVKQVQFEIPFLRNEVRVVIDGRENIPDEPFILAMNHSDAYSYMRFQVELIQKYDRFSTAWVKGKMIRQIRVLGFGVADYFYRRHGMIPVPSKAELLNDIFRRKFGLDPQNYFTNYREVKDVLDGKKSVSEVEGVSELEEEILERVDDIKLYHEQIMIRVGELTRSALQDHGLYVLIFPEGSRGQRLGKAYTGIAQVALHTKTPILPVGCSGGHVVFPSMSPIAQHGALYYQIGKPLRIDNEFADLHVPEDAVAFSLDAQRAHKEKYEAVTHRVMCALNKLVDERHRNDELYAA